MHDPGDTRERLHAEARRLEAEAVRTGEESEEGRELRTRAAQLRRRALGEPGYPVATCAVCLRVTGWIAASGSCDACLRRASRRAAFGDPHGGWVSVEDERPPVEGPTPPPLAARIAALVGLRGGLARSLAKAWLSRVDPDGTGPIDPEQGFELEGAHRQETVAGDRSGLLVAFSTSTHRFGDDGWMRLETSRIGSRELLTPTEFSAGLPIEQLAGAWADYRAEVTAFNRAAWVCESVRREAELRAREAGEDVLRDQSGIAALLDEGG
jgi:hypothetical protein